MMEACAGKPSLKQRVLKESHPLPTPGGRAPVYQLNLREVPQPPNSSFRLYEYGEAPDGIKRNEKVILVIGATGAGKTTLINSLINFIFGVEFGDNFRLKLIAEEINKDQSHSQTQHISAYTIHHQDGFNIPYTLTIIDTPGFGDTGGIKRDKQIAQKLYEFFKSDIPIVDHIDAVGFVAQASLARLTPSQKYIFDSILALFGKDIGENIFLLLTFGDGQPPQILAAIKAANIPHQSYFKFNNSAVFTDIVIAAGNDVAEDSDDEDNFNLMFWQLGMKSFRKFTKALEMIPTKSLKLTKEVLERRRCIEIYVEVMNCQVRAGMVKLKQLKQEELLLAKYEADIENNKAFEYEFEEVEENNEPVEDDFFTAIWRGVAGFVSWFTHTDIPVPPTHRVERKIVKKTKTLADVKARYEDAQGKQMSVQQVIAAIKEEFEEIQDQILFAICEIRESLNTLRKIALKDNPLSTVEYVDVMIQNERSQAKPGWQEHVEELNRIRECSIQLNKIASNDYDPFQEFADTVKQVTVAKGGIGFQRQSPGYPAYKKGRKAFLSKIKDATGCTTQ